jgi:hypothetical protein
MATTKITDLTAYTDPVNTDVLPIVDVTSDVTKKVSIANVMKNASLGTAAAPAISFDGDPNTGIYSPGADQVAVTTGGTQRLLIDSAGAVTIAGDLTVNGTTTNINTTNLVIEDKNIILGDVTTPTDVTADGGGITLKGTTDKTINWVDSTDAWTSSERFSYPLGSAAAPTLTFTGDANTGIYSPGADQVAISTNGTGRLFVDASGNVGVNVSSPTQARLVVASSSGANTAFFTDGTNSSIKFLHGGGGAVITTESGQYLAFGTSDTERMRLDSSGRLGLGTSAPGTILDVVGSGNPTITLRGSDGAYTGILNIQAAGGGASVINATGGANQLGLQTNGSNALSIDSSQRVGIGNSNPANAKLLIGTDLGALTTADRMIQVGHSAGGMIALGKDNTDYSYLMHDASTQKSHWMYRGALGLTLDTSGRLGIGTTSPSGNLDVASTGAATNIIVSRSTAGGQAYLSAAGNGSTVGSTSFDFIQDGAGIGYVFNRSAQPLLFGTNNTERARIDSSGRLLVGTSTARGDFFNTSGRAPAFQIEGTSTNAFGMSITANSAGDNGAEINLAKSRGTNTGSSTIVVNNDTLARISFQGADGSELVPAAYIQADVDGTPGANDMPGRLVFSTTADGASSPTERMRIAQNGNIDIGGAFSSGTRTKRLTPDVIQSSWDSTNSRTHQEFINPNGVVGSISTSGSATSFNTSSDYRLKENVVPLTGAANRINQLQVHRFNFIADPDITVDGFLAHEAQAVVPECVTGEKDAVDNEGNPVYQGIDQSKLVPLLTAALQEALAEIESLKARVTALEP